MPNNEQSDQEMPPLKFLEIQPPQLAGVWQYKYNDFISKIPQSLIYFGMPVTKEQFVTYFASEILKNQDLKRYNVFQVSLIELLQQSNIMLLEVPDSSIGEQERMTNKNIREFSLFVVIDSLIKLINTQFVITMDIAETTDKILVINDIRRTNIVI
jgi:hypothetical protein